MGKASSGSMMGPLQRLFGGEGTVAGLDDGQLLERFVVRHDEIAFEAIVNRHGPMVLGVCRRLLANTHDIEDAFQATFLVLARRAGSVRDAGRLSPWLYGVARKVAARARGQLSKRRDRENPGERDFAVLDPANQRLEAAETRSVLDDELARLPEKYRVPLVLCYLEGLTHDEAAQRLRWPVGTVRSRMASARDQLRRRLTSRGVAVPLALAAVGLASESARAEAVLLPPLLIARTVHSALVFTERAGGSAAVAAIPGSITILSHGVLKAMLIHKVAWCVGVGTVALGIVAGGARGVSLGAQGRGESKATSKPSSAATGTPPATNEAAPERTREDLLAEQQLLAAEMAKLQATMARVEADLQKLAGRSGTAKADTHVAAGKKVFAGSSNMTKQVVATKKRTGGLGGQGQMMSGMGGGMGGPGGMGGGMGGPGGMGGGMGGPGGMGGGMGGMGSGMGGGMMGGGRMGGFGGGMGVGMGGMGGGMGGVMMGGGGMGGGMGAMMGGGAGNGLPGASFLQSGDGTAILNKDRGKVTYYHTTTGKWETYTAPEGCKLMPIMGQGVLALQEEGEHITEVAVHRITEPSGENRGSQWTVEKLASPLKGTVTPWLGNLTVAFGMEGDSIAQLLVYSVESGMWYTKKLPKPIDGAVTPILSNQLAVYVVGTNIYAFSAHTQKWGVLELPEGAEPAPRIGNNFVINEHEGRTYVFRAHQGDWVDLDKQIDGDARPK